MSMLPEDPEEALRMVTAAMDALRVPATATCPPWCTLPAGHPYMPEDYDLPGERLMRYHETAFSLAGYAIAFHQSESAASAAGPIWLGTVGCYLEDAQSGADLSPQLLRDLATMFGSAADALTLILDAQEAGE